MKKEKVFAALERYAARAGQNIFLLPIPALERIYDCILAQRAQMCLELGTGLGTTTCVMAAALEEVGSGRVVTIDRVVHQPVNLTVLQEYLGLDGGLIEPVVDGLGYNWWLAEQVSHLSQDSSAQPRFDFCLLDGAHEWEPDALAALLAIRLLKPGATLVLDDVNNTLRKMMPHWQTIPQYAHYTDRQLDSLQMRMVYEWLMVPHPELENFRLTDGDRLGWATKRSSVQSPDAVRVVTRELPPEPASLRRMLRTMRIMRRERGPGGVVRALRDFMFH